MSNGINIPEIIVLQAAENEMRQSISDIQSKYHITHSQTEKALMGIMFTVSQLGRQELMDACITVENQQITMMNNKEAKKENDADQNPQS